MFQNFLCRFFSWLVVPTENSDRASSEEFIFHAAATKGIAHSKLWINIKQQQWDQRKGKWLLLGFLLLVLPKTLVCLSQNIKTHSFSFSSEEEEFFNFFSEIWWWEHHEACSISEECTTYWDCGIQVPFGYTRKDVILIGVGLTVFGVGLKFGLEVSAKSLLFVLLIKCFLN